MITIVRTTRILFARSDMESLGSGTRTSSAIPPKVRTRPISAASSVGAGPRRRLGDDHPGSGPGRAPRRLAHRRRGRVAVGRPLVGVAGRVSGRRPARRRGSRTAAALPGRPGCTGPRRTRRRIPRPPRRRARTPGARAAPGRRWSRRDHRPSPRSPPGRRSELRRADATGASETGAGGAGVCEAGAGGSGASPQPGSSWSALTTWVASLSAAAGAIRRRRVERPGCSPAPGPIRRRRAPRRPAVAARSPGRVADPVHSSRVLQYTCGGQQRRATALCAQVSPKPYGADVADRGI